jgi:hypothetical protein
VTRTSNRPDNAKGLWHLLLHCILVRPGTSAAIAAQSLSPCVCTASFSLLFSSSAHLPIRPLARSMFRSKTSCHLLLHNDLSFDPEPTRILLPNPCRRAFVPYPSACCLRLLSIYPCFHRSGRYGNPGHHAINYYTVFSFDLEPKSGNCTTILVNVRLYRILQLALFECCPSATLAWAMLGLKVDCHRYYTDFSFDPEPERKLQPNWFVLLAPVLLLCTRNCTSQLYIFF